MKLLRSLVIIKAPRKIRKFALAIRTLTITPLLVLRSRRSASSLIDPGVSLVVSLTSHGARLKDVHLTIESIGRGYQRPARIILWIDNSVSAQRLSKVLSKQVSRGLEIIKSDGNYGPHTKYFPYAKSEEEHFDRLVTADDDILYPKYWLSRLSRSSKQFPENILCYRAHRVRMVSPKELAPYNSWPAVSDTDSSIANFATGVSGVLYPAGFLDQLRRQGEAFMFCCPRADDVWLHSVAVENGWSVRQIQSAPRKFPEILLSQRNALHAENTGQSKNDEQIRRTYSRRTVSKLRRELSGRE